MTSTAALRLEAVAEDVFRLRDTCHVYVVRSGAEAVLIDFGSGDVLDALPQIGVGRVAAVLVTHHHRDQVQGLARAAAAGIPVLVPHAERELFEDADLHWAGRQLANSYDNRQDRFGPLDAVAVAGTLRDHADIELAGRRFRVWPTPGHTIGSVTLLCEVAGRRLAFTGDLLAGPGRVWSLAATQWTYNGAEGVAATIASLLWLRELEPDLLLPSHGTVMDDPAAAIDLVVERGSRLLGLRSEHTRLLQHQAQPYEQVTEHLLRNRTSVATSYVLLDGAGHALLIDYGYDFVTGLASATERAARRPWLYTVGALRRDHGVKAIDAVLLTHYHDDHVAGCNLLREVEGAEVWAGENFAGVLERPEAHDLPCLWHDPVPVDRALALGVPFEWRGHRLTLHEQPGHTAYAVAVEFEVDGVRVLAVGDQLNGPAGPLNYVYNNVFRAGDYRRTADLYRRLDPQLVLSGHSEPLWPVAGWADGLRDAAAELEHLHRELTGADELDLEAGGPLLRLSPYRVRARAGEPFLVAAEVRNPMPEPALARVALAVPAGWRVEPAEAAVELAAGAAAGLGFAVTPPAGATGKRVPLAADLSVGDRRFGQVAELVVRLG